MHPLTRAESSRYEETSLHADVMAFLAGIAAMGDPRLHVTSFGRSPEGRELPLLVLSAHGVRTPEDARRRGLPVLLWQCGIHPGEVEGKEAALMLVRELLTTSLGGLLEQVVLLIVPLFNPDGNDRIDPGNRRLRLPRLEGQLGPASGVGTRVNAAKINLNRDYLRMEAEEMRLLQNRVVQVWEPDLSVDCHATNGSVHRMAMTVDVPHTIESGRSEPILYMRDRVVPALIDAVRAADGFDSGWYGNFVEDERALDAAADADPVATFGEGWMTYPHHPRFGGNYRGLTNRLDLLLEAYSYRTFPERVGVTYGWLRESLVYVAAHADEILGLLAGARTPPERIAVRYRLERAAAPVRILTMTPRTLEGAPTEVLLPHLSRFVGTVVVDRPAAWVVPARVAAHLRLHGLTVEPIRDPAPLSVRIARVEGYGSEGGRAILEAARVGEVQVSWRDDVAVPVRGMALVRGDQPLGAIAAYLCEPESDDGAVENGLVDAPPPGSDFPIWRLEA